MNQEVREVLAKLYPGRHLLALHYGEDNRIEQAAAFLSRVTGRKERSMFFGGDKLTEEFDNQFRKEAAARENHSGRVLVFPERFGGGTPTAAAIRASVTALAAAALRDGYTGVRIVAEMTWVLDLLDDPLDFLPLLDDLDDALRVTRVTMVSQFREDRFPPELIFNVLRRHAVIVVGDGVFQNPFPDPQHMSAGPSGQEESSVAKPGLHGNRRDQSAPACWDVVMENLPHPLLLNDGRECRGNAAMRTILADPALAGHGVMGKLARLAPGGPEDYQLSLSGGRTFSFHSIAFGHDPALLLTVGLETTKMHDMAAELGTARLTYTEFLKTLPLGYLEVDRQGRTVSANARTASLLACPPEAIEGRAYLDLVHPLDRSKAALWLSRNGQDPSTLEMRLACRRGESWVKTQITPCPSPNLTGIIWEDINDRKKSEVLQLLSEELVTLQDRLRFLSTRDALTGLFNRQYFEEEIRRLKNPRFAPISVIIVDVDGLKPINDYFGHPKGDELLQCAARVLKKPFRETDMVARIGGDEFAVVLPQTPYELAQGRREEILKEVRGYNLDAPSGPPLSLSIGVATSARERPSLEETIKHADDDMYRFKLASNVYVSMTRRGRVPVRRGSTATFQGHRMTPRAGDTPEDRADGAPN